MIKTLLLSLCLLAPFAAHADDKAMPMNDKAHSDSMKHEKKSGKYHCDECNMDMKNSKEMRAHMKEHHGMEGYCEKCKMGFKTKDEEKAHMQSVHSKKGGKGMKKDKMEAAPTTPKQ